MKNKKIWKRVLIILLIVLLLLFGIGLYAGNYFYELALDPTTNKSIVTDAPINSPEGSRDADAYAERIQANLQWLIDKGGQDVEMMSYDGLHLKASLVVNETPTDNWAVVYHGYSGNGEQMIGTAKTFYDKGYNVLIPDARGCGDSEGSYYGMGWVERPDNVAWLEKLNAEYAPTNIVLYGVSMGGATVMMLSGETLPENVRAIVEDCGYSSVWDEFEHQLEGIFGLPSFPLMDFASIVTKVRAGYSLRDGDAVAQVAKSVTPILFIHGDQDTFVPSWMIDVVYDAATCEKEKLVIEGAGHGAAASVAPELYWNTVDTFIAKYMK